MHILFLSDNFPPEVNAPASRTHEHCRQWVTKGHQVTVITCVPNFPKGKVFTGYRNRVWQEEQIDGIRVIRVWTYISANEGFARRILDYISFMFSSTCAGFALRGVDVVVGTSPQFFTACAAWVVSAAKRVPFVFELRDIWPESIKAVGAMENSYVFRALERVELFLYRRATRIVSVTHSFRRTLMARGIDGTKIDVVTNGVDSSRFAPKPKDVQLEESLGLSGKFVAGYIGTHGMAHGLETLIEAAQKIEADRFVFLFLGDGAEKPKLRRRVQELALKNVIFVDTVPKDQVVRYWSLLDASIVHLKRNPLFTTVIPSKLFECMGMGIPVLLGVQGESADIVNREQVGLTFEPENPHDLIAKLRSLEGQPEARARFKSNGLAAAGRYDRSELAEQMLNSLQQASSV
jgi:hypothetical protein